MRSLDDKNISTEMRRRLRHIGFWKDVHQKRMYLEKCSGRSAFFKILIHMHNLKMCSGSSSSGRLTVASIAFLFELHVEVCLSPQPPLPPNFNVGSSCFSCAAALAFGTCAQPRIKALVAESPGQFCCVIMLWRLPGRSPRESRPCS